MVKCNVHMRPFCTPRIVTLGVQKGRVISRHARVYIYATARTAIARFSYRRNVCLSVRLSVTLCAQNKEFIFFAILGYGTHFKSELRQIDLR